MAPTSDIAVSETETVREPKIFVSGVNSAQQIAWYSGTNCVSVDTFCFHNCAASPTGLFRQCHANPVEQCTVNYSSPSGEFRK